MLSSVVTELKSFDAAEEQLNQRFMQRKRALEQDAVLYPKLGVLAAAAAFLLLI